MPIIKPPHIDLENLASKLPEPFQWPAGAILGGLNSILGGDDPASAAVASMAPTPLMAAGPGVKAIGRGLEGPHPAIRALMDMLHGQPEGLDPVKVFSQEKVGGFQVPHRSLIIPPEGFELPSETSAFPARSPELIDQFNLRRDSGLGRASDHRVNGSKAVPNLKGLPKVNRINDAPSGFESKFSLAGLGEWPR